MFLEDVTAETEARMLDEFTLPAARDLATISPDIVIFGCTSASALRGNEYEEKLIAEIEQVSGAPAISVSKSVRETLKNLHARQLVVITPYLDELNERIRASLEQDHFEVLNIEGLQILENTKIARVTRRRDPQAGSACGKWSSTRCAFCVLHQLPRGEYAARSAHIV